MLYPFEFDKRILQGIPRLFIAYYFAAETHIYLFMSRLNIKYQYVPCYLAKSTENNLQILIGRHSVQFTNKQHIVRRFLLCMVYVTNLNIKNSVYTKYQ